MMDRLGFSRLKSDHLVFFKFIGDTHIVIAVATNNMALTSKRLSDLTDFKEQLKQHVEISDMEELNWFLRFEVC
jgi:hypothetical protein